MIRMSDLIVGDRVHNDRGDYFDVTAIDGSKVYYRVNGVINKSSPEHTGLPSRWYIERHRRVQAMIREALGIGT